MPQPLCFVLMPFGQKPDESGRIVDFDRVYRELIKPAIEAADLDPIRADEEATGGIIHKPMFERLMLCDYAVADLTTANANVFYELRIRHGIRPYTTVLVFAQGLRLPFDVAPLRGLPYRLDKFGAPEAAAQDRDALAERLKSCRNPSEDSPLFQLVQNWPRPDIARLKTDKFRELVDYSRSTKERLAAARRAGAEAVRAIEDELEVADADPAIIVDLLAQTVGKDHVLRSLYARGVALQAGNGSLAPPHDGDNCSVLKLRFDRGRGGHHAAAWQRVKVRKWRSSPVRCAAS